MGKYTRKTDRQSWSEVSMANAIKAVEEKTMGWLKAAKTFGVPQATLRRRVEGGKNKIFKGSKKGLGRFQPTFDADTEKEVLDHIKLLESRGFGLTPSDVRKVAFQLAKKNGLEHRFNCENEAAGWDWLAGFRKRNPGISLRKPEGTSFSRASGFNQEIVSSFFKIYDTTCSSMNNVPPNRIYNLDESALSTVQESPKVYATTGKKQVGTITSAERGSHITVVCGMSATGHYIPPVFVFARKNFKHELLDGAPTGSIGLVQKKGWITGELFLKVLEHVAKHTKPSNDDKILLIVDGHSSHKDVAVLEFAKRNGIVMLCLPPHCTHRMQPLDVSFFGPLKTFYNQEVHKWMRNNPGRVVTTYQVCSIFSSAYGKAATVINAENGFLHTGLYPFNPDIFPQHLFAPSETTRRIREIEEENQGNSVHTIECSPGPSTSTGKVAVADISPLPQAQSPIRKRQKKRHEAVLTSSPFIVELKEKQALRLEKEQKKSVRATRKRLEFQPDDAFEEGLFDNDDEDDAACIYCNELYSKSRAKAVWLQCMKCKLWAHLECTGLDKKAKIFVCELCS